MAIMRYTRHRERFLACAVMVLNRQEYDYVPCAYCGWPATDKEHVYPRAHKTMAEELGILPMRTLWIVPSCRECNLLAGGKIFNSFTEKRQFIQERLRRRYKRELQIPHWTEPELTTLSDNLASMVRRACIFRDLLRQRLRWNGNSR